MSKITRLFFATDIHGSELCFKKFLAAAKFYKADVLVLGGDITGKNLIPILDLDGTYKANYLGREIIAKTPEDLKRLEELITNSGYYYYHCNVAEMKELKSSKELQSKIFNMVMKKTLLRWIDYAEHIMRDSGTVCYITGGNDDPQEIIDAFKETDHVKNPDNRVVKIDSIHEMASLGFCNMTPWKCPRDCSDEELGQLIEKLMSSVSDLKNCVFNFHAPPINCGDIDRVPKLDDSVFPPRPVVKGGQVVWVNAGSESVRRAIEQYQPLVDLTGHIHEGRGVCKIGRTIVINPGSEYTEGILKGVIVNLADKKVISWQLTSG